MRCDYCGKETSLPFRCHLCGGFYCVEHRLPESHSCSGLWKARRPKKEAYPSWEREVPRVEVYREPRRVYIFSGTELKHLLLSVLLVTCVGMSLVLGYLFTIGPLIVLVLGLVFAFSFLAHELSHKLLAQKNGLWAEFRMSLMGAVITLISIFSPIKFISPGAVMVAGILDRRIGGRISLAGPLTNLTISTFFAAFTFLLPRHSVPLLVCRVGSLFNAYIALFNLVPLGSLDGLKVFMWNKTIWALAFILSILLTVYAYIYL